MPAQKWTAERNERLLLLIIKNVKVDAALLAAEWSEKYSEDEFQPTVRAITEQFKVLSKRAGGKGEVTNSKDSKAVTKKAPMTPKKTTKSATPKTPASSGKRKKVAMSDEDDSEADLQGLSNKLQRRASLSRTSKSSPTKYDDQDEDQAANEADDDAKGIKLETGRRSSLFDHELNFDGAGEPKPTTSRHLSMPYTNGGFKSLGGVSRKQGAPAKKRVQQVISDDDDSVSNFSDGF